MNPPHATLPALSTLRVSVPDHVVSRVVDGALILLDVDTGRSVSLDAVGNRAWLALTESPTAQDALERLLGEFQADPALLEGDLKALISNLASRNLLRLQPSGQ